VVSEEPVFEARTIPELAKLVEVTVRSARALVLALDGEPAASWIQPFSRLCRTTRSTAF